PMTPGADLALFGISVLAGIIGALAGVGGGILVIPALTTIFGVDIHLAIGASIVSIIATSSGAAVAYVRDRLTNLRVGMFLEVATSTGAVGGALAAAVVAPQLLYVLLAAVLGLSVLQQVSRLGEELPPEVVPSRAAASLRLASSYPDQRLGREVPYAARRVGLGFVMMLVAGFLSGLLGIGSGVLKVLAMDGVMRLPMKVSTATSNFMIGVTAAASAGIYLGRGDVDARLAAPVALGVLAGALLGSRILVRLRNRQVRLIFVPIMVVVALQMLAKGLGLHVAFLG
ncbi:MAG TPA: sulfite exporter TauE/SafE family protein, partial [Candidatus Baltobacteraceae bacterium]|nr:sulfite exporter TauE/SafE family protein [Candidatus Baltobacteraceae bacterium]